MEKDEKELGDSVSTAVRLPRKTVEWLRTLEGGISGGIRRALDQLVMNELFDEPTRALAFDVMLLARQLEAITGSRWTESPEAYEAFSVALKTWLDEARPDGWADPQTKLGMDDPRTVGRTVAKMFFLEKRVKRGEWKKVFGADEPYGGDK